MTDATFLQLIHGIEWDKLTAAEAVELRTALREAVAKSEKWFAGLAAGFNDTQTRGAAEASRAHNPTPAGSTPVPATKPKFKRRTTAVVHPPKAPRTRASKSSGQTSGVRPPAGSAGKEHPPVGVSADLYVSTTGPDPNRSASLPLNHPRRAGGTGFDPSTVDPDFAAASRKMPDFN